MLLAQIVVQNVNSHLPIIEIVSLCLLGKQDTCALGFVTFSTVPTDVVGHHEMCVCCVVLRQIPSPATYLKQRSVILPSMV